MWGGLKVDFRENLDNARLGLPLDEWRAGSASGEAGQWSLCTCYLRVRRGTGVDQQSVVRRD